MADSDYYDLLGISPFADAQEIKKAFRNKAKLLHPDMLGNEGGSGGAEEAMRAIITAYETLLDEKKRGEYDRKRERLKREALYREHFESKTHFDYEGFLEENKGDKKLQARLVFYRLLKDKADAALEAWRASGGLAFDMRRYMDREDWMDCLFLLAEELERRSFYEEALTLVKDIAIEEELRPYFKHFALDVRLLLNSLTRKVKSAKMSKRH